ncbi:NHLP bacteriocin system secretion protein [Anabaena cylindrica UHCC 0172]|uniref:NHLP bacteriocin system secretion protein n=1 Tax=Anabaena cylindrica TaxID=1165 RepID=UPI002B221479|nr:NHLP bacteriocin system secretion protein [Anabaena cylindrica]MEA5551023.1 NHLP bacteriocin system secretion protein [Anabaena cylindrica UHCC 0172]
MLDRKEHIFRKKSLERLSSPEQLDRVVQVVKPQDWLPLGMLGLLVSLGLLWSVLGRLPMTVTGQGVLINPRRILQFQSPISGQLKSLNIRDGQCVKKDEVLASVDPSEERQQLQQRQGKLTQLRQQNLETRLVRIQRTSLEKDAIASQRASLQQQLQNSQSLTPILQKQGLVAIQQQRTSLQQQLRDSQQLAPIFATRLQNRQQLIQVGAISQDTLLQAEQEYRQSLQSITNIQSQLQQLQLQEVETQQKHLNNLNEITKFQAELEELATRNKRLEQDNLENTQTRDKELQDVQREIAQLEQRVADNSQIKSPQTGCIVEITAAAGQVVEPGTRLGTMQMTDQKNEGLESGVVYFAVADGKQIQPGMKILVTPDTIKRERFGSIVGEVVAVSPLPITREGATSVVGNSEVVNKLIGSEGSKIEIMAKLNLNPSTVSGYQWSSSNGPNTKLTLGTTVTAKVTVEETAPITFLLPILREWSGIN